MTVSLIALAACSGNSKPTGGKAVKISSSAAVPNGYYRVKAGDTLFRIAKRYGQSVATLAAWNNLADASKIEVGQLLRVRRNTSSAATTGQPAHAVTPVNRLALQWPTDNGRQNIIQYYHATRNKGLNIGGMLGQNIKAAAAGKVLYVGEGVRGYGKLILISHNSNTITAYAHNDSILVREDQQVQAGQVIATMGNSDTDSVKLHFEVRINGKAVDPMPHLPN
ncbi:peptidoglycan DD-metalloendopeptidase family protein [Neisseria animalis]|uniref:LysM peptidoglycan-binding domain-containing protein n=1 Tax=Neisseria animalis TaxID=492 RepID=A0A5P3MTL2_NEIAN|nr:peptidoglycan DD-metalloendopeptidase family protein [Neisseria animalis]QEY24415.1 LysM peptidoglycan-binding domain-containing protein [Neisseria animalis]ROW31892.1 LysM peptidoglycan-binding domain-containing protein [Neisseria animalis]VEE07010.1 membrane peptidase [Neisseria animalis]